MVGRSLKQSVQGLIAAIQFLTRIPIPVQVPFDPPTLARSLIAFPFAGLLIGLLTGGGAALLQLLHTPMISAALLLAWWIVLTGGLHLDGWMDTADGLLSGRSRERMLDIMKDSRVGAMGVIAGFVLMLVKFAALFTLFERTAVDQLYPFALLSLAPVWSRWWMTVAITRWPFAREGGLAALFQQAGKKHIAGAAIIALGSTTLMLELAIKFGMDRSCAWLYAAILVAATLVFGGMMARWMSSKLGGLTGDTYGAMNEGLEALWIVVVSWLFLA
ncbi:cobalamin 5'-phosphate synthase [Paenibacillus curdlanolyticus YK9]|uniref:Adenosylcobinamide-GDP ribazoletransferase n=1 Tax=Paenibacillus curdlanolyticus YK9 TaxID=717606 RepID=E0I4F0_9BACL|nr:adenosylcobinamide-GDP ribazoletransferase [Paenibacillus curdlanolyticus]EFM13164.1 cobalamin 5'-phosphate synthase [Paenibacillus curdlanolyticus YK9]